MRRTSKISFKVGKQTASELPRDINAQAVSSPVQEIIGLQKAIGNQAVHRLFKSGAIQPKLKVSRPDDPYEQEADRIAEQVMNIPDSVIQRKPGIPGKTDSSRIQASLGSGSPLPESARAYFEPRFGQDLSDVRVHDDSKAADSARAVNAKAFTSGRDIVFDQGRYSPESNEGRQLLAHELAHVLQPSDHMNGGREIQRKPFPGESPELEKRRKAAVAKARTIIEQIELALTRGYLWRNERLSDSKIENIGAGVTETQEERRNRLVKLTDDLSLMITELEKGPIPAEWLEVTIQFPGEGTAGNMPSITIPGPDVTTGDDVKLFYGHRMQSMGMGSDAVWLNMMNIESEPVHEPKISRMREESELLELDWIVVEDPENRPHVYQHLRGYGEHGTIVGVGWDRRGYFYFWKGRKIYLPEYNK